MKVREHAKQLPKELIKDITLKSAERSLLSTHDGSHFSPKQSPEQYASDRLEEGIKWSASKGETIVSQGSKKAAKKKAEKTWRVIKERRSKNADRTAEQSRNSGTQGNSQTERQTDIRIKTKEAVNKRTAGVARENIAEVKNVLWSSIFVTLMANKIGGLQFGIYRNCQISSRVFHTAVAALPLTKANRSDFE